MQGGTELGVTRMGSAAGPGRDRAPVVTGRLAGRARHTLLAVLVLYPVTLVLLASRLGPGLLWDSVTYASVARSFASTGELVDFTGTKLTLFPPGLPVLVGSIVRVGMDLQPAVVALNTASVAVTVLLTYVLASHVVRSPLAGLLSASVVAISVSTVRVFSVLLSEPLFTALAMASLVILTRACRDSRLAWWQVVAVGAVVSAATTIRFVGFTLIPVVVLGAVLANKSRGWFRASCIAVAAGAVSSIGLVAVALRNLDLGVAPLGDRLPSGLSAYQVLGRSIVTLGGYLVFPGAGVAACAGLSLALVMLYGMWRVAKERDAVAVVVAAFVAVYWLSLVYGEIATTIEPVSERMTTPVFAPMVVLVAYAVKAGRLPDHKALRAGAAGLLLAASALSLVAGVGFALFATHEGYGYNNLSVRRSALAHSLSRLPPDAGIAAFAGPQVYWATGRTPITPIPWTNFYEHPAEAEAQLSRLKARVRSGAVDYLACFDTDRGVGAMTPRALEKAGIKMRLVATFPDGTLWKALPSSR